MDWFKITCEHNSRTDHLAADFSPWLGGFYISFPSSSIFYIYRHGGNLLGPGREGIALGVQFELRWIFEMLQYF